MQALVEKHGAKLVAGGSLNGKEYGQLSIEQLRKVAKRYQADAQLQKYARARVALLELEGPGEDPVPCAPLRPVFFLSERIASTTILAASAKVPLSFRYARMTSKYRTITCWLPAKGIPMDSVLWEVQPWVVGSSISRVSSSHC